MKIFQANLNQKAAIVAISKTNRRHKRQVAPEGLSYIERSKNKFKILYIIM